ncbi:formate dehydrogenase accessory protein FdhE [Desulfitobacterium metallireducens]|uniref:Formate dehydrogenase accessory protein FdhE n=1 Tax=Desulfitobacterium metallireducens DSM 15288 TaxID=871968 RepID=W0E9X9_9FIRM|nr:formate dehydrogenase accessory protein FdhE [Desulfitobacterium metallireducens]AHF05861.1 formate dehydrogenase accessory protein FdhE [Desulfitobacterium metallireducens DSM 15288]
MGELKGSNATVDKAMEIDAFYKVYQKLQNVIFQWQEERGQYWAQSLVPDKNYPYFSLSRLPEEPVLELVKRLLEASERLCPLEELHSSWNHYRQEQKLESQELFSHFTLAVSGVIRLARQSLPENLRQKAGTEGGLVCPICGQAAGLSVLVPPIGKRVLHCTRCDHEWPGKRVGCIHCGSEEALDQTYLKNEDFPGIEIVVCQACGGDFKEVDLRERRVEDWGWEDIRTLPLNYAAEKWLHEQAQKKILI